MHSSIPLTTRVGCLHLPACSSLCNKTAAALADPAFRVPSLSRMVSVDPPKASMTGVGPHATDLLSFVRLRRSCAANAACGQYLNDKHVYSDVSRCFIKPDCCYLTRVIAGHLKWQLGCRMNHSIGRMKQKQQA